MTKIGLRRKFKLVDCFIVEHHRIVVKLFLPMQEPNPFEREKDDEGEKKITRREFLKGLGLTLGGLALSSPLLEILKEKEKGEEKKKEASVDPPTEEQEEIEEEDISSLCEVLDYEKEGDIKLDLETMEAIKNYWKKRYQESPELRNSLLQAYRKMGEWEDYLMEEFRKQGIEEKYAYLSIPESHWRLNAVSPAGAVGPYQFMPQTARSYGLKTSYFKDHHPNIEERRDPIKSARACASLLSDLYEASGDWSLSLSGYNGGFFWRYLKQARSRREDISYEGFLDYLEKRINKIKDEVQSSENERYRVRSEDNMTSIAQRFNMQVEELCRINNIENENQIYVGQEIVVPVPREKKRELFKRKIRGMVENLNYPHKFDAIYELIEEGFVEDKDDLLFFEKKEVKGSGVKEHIFKREDKSIYSLASNFSRVTVNDILEANSHIDPDNLQGGERIIIPGTKEEPTIRGIAKENGVDVKRLQKINPAIRDPREPIPAGYKIRV